MNRRQFLKEVPCKTFVAISAANELMAQPLLAVTEADGGRLADASRASNWLARWQKQIVSDADRWRYCDKEMGEELGWLVSPFLNGFYYGHVATGDTKWLKLLVEWMDACIQRGVKGPDGFLGWPKDGGNGGDSREYSVDSLLGEAMLLRPAVLMAGYILKTPGLAEKWGDHARTYLKLAEATFQKWDSRECWREVKDGGLWVVPAFGAGLQGGQYSAGFASVRQPFSNPANKQNHIARWLLAMHDVTGKSVYRKRAELWFRLMKSRMRTHEDGKYFVWNYWDPAGPWDYKPDGSPRHWVGVHPNGGYYEIDVAGIITAFEHGLVFTREDTTRLIATNRDYMWNQRINGAQFQRIDGEPPDPRWKNSPGVLWTALVPHDNTLRKIFLATHDPASWDGLVTTPWFLSITKT